MVFPTQVRSAQVAPYGTVGGMQDVGSLLTAIMPIVMIMMVFMMMTPMFKGMSKGFES